MFPCNLFCNSTNKLGYEILSDIWEKRTLDDHDTQNEFSISRVLLLILCYYSGCCGASCVCVCGGRLLLLLLLTLRLSLL